MTLVNTNVLVDVITDDASWGTWSIAQLDAAELKGPLVINDIVYAELSVRLPAIEAGQSHMANRSEPSGRFEPSANQPIPERIFRCENAKVPFFCVYMRLP